MNLGKNVKVSKVWVQFWPNSPNRLVKTYIVEISLKCKDVGIEANSNRWINSKAKLALQANAHNLRNFIWEKLDIYSSTYISIQKVRHLFIKRLLFS